jgi:hypothetical protein
MNAMHKFQINVFVRCMLLIRYLGSCCDYVPNACVAQADMALKTN